MTRGRDGGVLCSVPSTGGGEAFTRDVEGDVADGQRPVPGITAFDYDGPAKDAGRDVGGAAAPGSRLAYVERWSFSATSFDACSLPPSTRFASCLIDYTTVRMFGKSIEDSLCVC